MSNLLSEVMLSASQASYTYGATGIPEGYSLDTRFDSDGVLKTNSGFTAIALCKNGVRVNYFSKTGSE